MKKETVDSRNRKVREAVFTNIFLMLLTFLVAVPSIQGQQLTGRPEQGSGPDGGYQTTNIDSISLQNGAVNLSLPLASLPPIAGGKLSYTLTASYNGKLWKTLQQEEWQYPLTAEPGVPYCPTSYSTQTVVQSDGSGWQVGGQEEIFYRDAQ